MTLPPISHTRVTHIHVGLHLAQNNVTLEIHYELLIITYPYREQKFQGAKVLGSESSWNFRSRERKFQGTKVPGSESSMPWYFRSRERKFLGAKVPVTRYQYRQSHDIPRYIVGSVTEPTIYLRNLRRNFRLFHIHG